MEKRNIVSLATLYAISPVHAGSGTSTAAVDLPIQRERHTNWPHIQASGVKGSFRSHYRTFSDENGSELINHIFGSDEQDGWDRNEDSLAAAVSFSDAKLLFFPVRSNISPFLWVTCPAVLTRLNQDLQFTGIGNLSELPEVTGESARWIGNEGIENGRVVLEDAVVQPEGHTSLAFIQEQFPDIQRALIISDEMFDYVVSSCTEVQTQIKINAKTGTAEDGALRYEELLPSDSLLYTIVHCRSRNGIEDQLQAEQIQANLESVIKDFIQIGGDATLGRGVCRLNWLKGGQS
jgi:CRISPR-associated protein Cmr4